MKIFTWQWSFFLCFIKLRINTKFLSHNILFITLLAKLFYFLKVKFLEIHDFDFLWVCLNLLLKRLVRIVNLIWYMMWWITRMVIFSGRNLMQLRLHKFIYLKFDTWRFFFNINFLRLMNRSRLIRLANWLRYANGYGH